VRLQPKIANRTSFEHLGDVNNLPRVGREMNSYTKKVFEDISLWWNCSRERSPQRRRDPI